MRLLPIGAGGYRNAQAGVQCGKGEGQWQAPREIDCRSQRIGRGIAVGVVGKVVVGHVPPARRGPQPLTS